MIKKIKKYNNQQIKKGNFTSEDLFNLIKYFQYFEGLEVDGLMGPATINHLRIVDTYRDVKLPSTREEVIAMFGNPGTLENPNKKWARENMTLIKSFIIPQNKLYVHKLIAGPLLIALRAVSEKVPGELKKIGAYSHRNQRHRKNAPLSYHAFGIALDINPRDNQVKYFAKNEAPEPFSKEWYEYWPNGLSKEFVECFKEVGFSWGGDWRGNKMSRYVFKDPMHFEYKK